MQSLHTRKYLFLFSCLFCIVSCSKDEKKNDEPPVVATAIGSCKDQIGIGENDGVPDGTDFQLPACAKIVDRPGYRFSIGETKIYGSTRTFYVPVSFVNSCASPAPIEIPGGLILNSQFRDGQNGLLVERVLIDLPPSGSGGSNDTTTIYLAVSCLNENRTPPVSMHDAQYNVADFGYSVGKITTDKNILSFIKLLQGYTGLKVTAFATNLPPEPGTESSLDKMHNEIQLALWKITNGDGLSADEVQKLLKSLQAYK